jgi:tetratricopeptide (TPR) repeat protein
VLTNVAIATAQTGDRVEAAQLLVEAVRVSDHSVEGKRIENAVAALLDIGHLHDAIELVGEVVQRHPEAASYRRMLVGFLGEAQLIDDVGEHMKTLIEQRQFDLPLLLATTETSSRRFSKNTIEMLRQKNPGDHRPRLGEAKQFLDQRDAKSAQQTLQEIIQHHPDFAPAHAMLGVALVALGQTDQLDSWYRHLPEPTRRYSGYWLAMGQWSASRDDWDGAVRAMAEATRLAPNEPAYWAMLSDSLRQWQAAHPTSDTIDVDLVLETILNRQALLLALRDEFAAFKSQGQTSQSLAVKVAKTLHELGRHWESEAWLAVATNLPDEISTELSSFRQQVMQTLASDRDWQSRSGHPEIAFDVSKLPLPIALMQTGDAAELDPSHRDESGTRRDKPILSLNDAKPIRMRNMAESLGLSFLGRVGDEVDGPMIPITQTLGCGGGMIDFDQDGRQDLVFAAAGGQIREQDSDLGALFRNQGQLVDVSSPSGFADPGYSQGIVVADFNDDGFADLLVLNLGPNRLFRNNGDGSFSDVSELLGDQGIGRWSTSGAILDVNRDGYNDIVIANYCDINDPLEDPCFDSDGRRINCYPLQYRAEQDQVLSGRPDGTFVDVTESWIGEATLGRGLGIVGGRLDGQETCVYIVNDASPNTLFRWNPEKGRLVDQGIASGLAVDAQSLDQGSMGIASSDLDHDGDLDFYVTGFANEYNILYEQQTPGFWRDVTASKGMVSETLRMVGFGSAAVDFDNDGVDELVVTNGHVGVFGPPLPPYEQPFQLFRRAEDGRYPTVDLQASDPYFAKDHVGRALFTGDINADGMCDVVVTHMTEPAAVLINDSEQANHRITFRLVDRVACRDAAGATVDFKVDGAAQTETRRLFQLAGHGYLSSNQPLLWAGTGSATRVRDVAITWPDGTQQPIGDLESNASYLIVRNESTFLLQRY